LKGYHQRIRIIRYGNGYYIETLPLEVVTQRNFVAVIR